MISASSRMKAVIVAGAFGSLVVSSLILALMYVSDAAFVSATGALAFIGFAGWAFAFSALIQRQVLNREIHECVHRFGMAEPVGASIEGQLEVLLEDVYVKSRALAEIPLQKRINGERALNQCLDEIAGLLYELIQAESVEISLCNPVNNLYRCSLVKGIPIQADIHETIERNLDEPEHTAQGRGELLKKEISFVDQKLGLIRVALPAGRVPTHQDHELMAIIALRCGMVLIGHGYSEELLSLHRRSGESDREKTGFLATLSHEVRGPLGIILNAVELVLDGLCGDINADQRETLGMIHSNGRHLLELINDVLDYAKVEAGMLQAKPTEISVGDLLTDLSQVVRGQAETKSHHLVVGDLESDLGMFCDRRHARQILINLLTNAIKYTPDGGMIELWAERTPQGNTLLHVRDNGVGIREEDHAKVFLPFERIENGYAQKQSGTGLGMPLTKSLVEMNGGAISFESKPARGTHFTVSLPYRRVTRQLENENKRIERLTVQGRGEIVLIFARPDEERAVLERYFKHAGFLALVSSDLLEVEEILKGPRIHLCIIDNHMLDTGDELLVSRLSAHSAFGKVPIVAVSSRGFAHDIERYLMMGVDRCFVKPIELREFGRAIRDLLDRNSATAPRLGV